MRSLGKKPHFGAFPEAQKGVLICTICLRKAAHWPNNNANPSGVSEKTVLLCRKSAILSIRWKKPHFGPSLRPQKAQKANWRSRLHAQSSQMHSIPLGPSEKFLLSKSTKKARYVKWGFFPKDRTYRAFFVLLHKRNFFRMAPKGLNAFGALCMQPRAPVSFLSFLGPEGRPQMGFFPPYRQNRRLSTQ